MGTGYGLADNLGKTVVIYSSTGLRIGCGVLASKASDSALSELGSLVQQGKYFKSERERVQSRIWKAL